MGINGNRLRKLRENKGVYPAEIAKYLGISRPAYLKYENGKTSIPRQIERLASYFNVSVDYLLENDPPATENACLSSDESNLINEYRELDPADRNRVTDYLHYLRFSNSQRQSQLAI